ncbi:WD repeat-containing protein 31 [Aphelenchoides fujianensis]|nr:WD repeat-containing protein 31 [Aphelenchoides fujianensis]
MGNNYSLFGHSIEHRIKSFRNAFLHIRTDVLPRFCRSRPPALKRIVHVPAKHPCDLHALAAIDSNWLLTGGQDGIVRVYDFTDGSIVNQWDEHGGQVTKLDYSFQHGRGMFLSRSADETIRLFDMCNQKAVQQYGRAGMTVEGLSFLEGDHFLSAGFNSGLLVWNAETAEVVAEARADGYFITNMCRVPQSELMCTSGIDGRLQLWDLSSMSSTATLTANGLPLTSCTVDSSGRFLLATEGLLGDEEADKDENFGGVQLWDLRQGQLIDRFYGHQKPAVAAFFLSNGLNSAENFVSIGDDQQLVVWSAEDSEVPLAAEPLTDVAGDPRIGAAALLGTNRLAIVGQDGLVASVEIFFEKGDDPRIHVATMESQHHDRVNELWQRKLESLGFV